MSHLMSKWVIVAGLVIAIIVAIPQTAMGQQAGQMQQQAPQIDISDQELKTFVKVQEKLKPAQDSARQQIMAAINDAGLKLDTYKKVSRQIQMAKSMDEVDAPKEQVQKVQKASQKVQTIQQSFLKEQQKIVSNEGMSMRRFQKIRQAAIKDRKLLQRMQMLQQKNK